MPESAGSVKFDKPVTRHLSLAHNSLNSPMPQLVFGPIVPDTAINTVMAAYHSAEVELFNVEAEMASSLQDMSNEELRSFAELQEDPARYSQGSVYDEVDIQVSHAAQLGERYQRTSVIRELEKAINMMESILHIIPNVTALVNLMTMLT